MGDEAIRLDSKKRDERFIFAWSCAKCGELLLESSVPTSISIEALERLEACDRKVLNAMAHQCA